VVYGLYNFVLILGFPLVMAWLLLRGILFQRIRAGMGQRFGMLSPQLYGRDDQPRIWVHAVSVGEVMAAVSLIRHLSERYTKHQIILSTVTETGQAVARRQLPDLDGLFFFPFDLPLIVRKVIVTVRPSLFIFLETEIWPNLLRELKRYKIPSVLVNGRISAKSFKRYRLIRPLLKEALAQVDLFLMQTQMDVDRMVALGAPPDRVVQTGNLKFDQIGDSSTQRELKEFSFLDGEPVIVAGSTHEGEEAMLLEVYQQLLHSYPKLRLILAPRHPHRLEQVEGLLEASRQTSGVTWARRTEMDPRPGQSNRSLTARVILLDTMGELKDIYQTATVVFIGGSLVPKGGHNLLEPAACGKPVLFGPHMDNFIEIAEAVKTRGIGIQVQDTKELSRSLQQLLDDPARREAMGQEAKQWVQNEQGVVQKDMAWIEQLIG
jgi:3-deoxy-D-manno-octulosonic-acid transferase